MTKNEKKRVISSFFRDSFCCISDEKPDQLSHESLSVITPTKSIQSRGFFVVMSEKINLIAKII